MYKAIIETYNVKTKFKKITIKIFRSVTRHSNGQSIKSRQTRLYNYTFLCAWCLCPQVILQMHVHCSKWNTSGYIVTIISDCNKGVTVELKCPMSKKCTMYDQLGNLMSILLLTQLELFHSQLHDSACMCVP